MAFNLFKKKEDATTPFYSIDSLTDEQKQNIRKMYTDIQSGTSTLDDKAKETVVEINRRLNEQKMLMINSLKYNKTKKSSIQRL